MSAPCASWWPTNNGHTPRDGCASKTIYGCFEYDRAWIAAGFGSLLSRRDLLAADADSASYTEFAEALGLTRTAIKRLIADCTGRIEAAADDLIKEFEEMSVAAAVRAGQLRIIRTVRTVVIREMAARLP